MSDQNTASGRQGWKAAAACAKADPDMWFPAVGAAKSAKKAKAVCRDECPVRAACLDFAIRNGENQGIWGGHNMGKPKIRALALAEHAELFPFRAAAA